MGREIKRVPLDFDWPISWVWPGYMTNVCSEEVSYCLPKEQKEDSEKVCEYCRKAAKLANREIKSHGCPEWQVGPPQGDGWQMWETTTEGSPISPVFATPEELAQWLADTGASSFGKMTASYKDWLTMIKEGWAMSAAVSSRGLESGVQFVAQEKRKKNHVG